MRITEYEVIPVAFPDPPLRNSTGVHEPFALRTLVRLKTDDGLTGWGETYGGSQPAANLEAARDTVLGWDPFALEALRLRVPDPRTYAPLEVACLDLAGQALGQPVYNLLGGKVRDPISFAAYLFYHFDCPRYGECLSPGAMVEQARRLVREHGFEALKLKGGVLPPDEEVETIRALRREFGPDFRLRHDPNAIWSVETSIRVTRELEGELEYMEDPTWGVEGMARVRAAVSTPLSTNMCLTGFEDFPENIRLGAVDVVLSDHHFWGGLRATQEMGRICRTWGLGVSMHSNSHLGVSLAAMLHAAAATPHLTYACDTHYVWLEEDILEGGKVPFRGGQMSVPDGPGLGIRVDEDQVARMAEAYRRCGLTRRDDVGYMRRKYDPTWEALRPRW
ncbi:MAG TPA: enolase C-terminal domain-like protein [Armatimonadota bacterium]|nr:enolase C-terminal domain-like protein [Armatimonadota bacterium]